MQNFTTALIVIVLMALSFPIGVVISSLGAKQMKQDEIEERDFMIKCLESGKRSNDCYQLFLLKNR